MNIITFTAFAGLAVSLYFHYKFFKKMKKEKQIRVQKDSFMATLTHDLKTPTYAQIRMLTLLLDGHFGQLNDEQKEMVQLTCCSCRYMADLIAIVLETYKCKYGNITLNPEVFDIVYLTKKLSKGIKGLADEKSQNLVFEYNRESCCIFGDRLQIKRVILNLLSNAITYGFNNTTVRINLIANEETVEFSVENKSKQIPESDLKNLFKKFTKTEMSHFNKTSTSLGLYISKEIIDLHKGEIYAKSFEDGTCIFGFKLFVNKEVETNEKTCCKC